jgi:prolyl oligopeptidase
MTTRSFKIAAAALFLAVSGAIARSAAPDAEPPQTEKIPVRDIYHGVSVVDDYRWLENGDDPKVKAWVDAQNAYTQAYLSKLPQRAGIVTFLKATRQKAQVQYSDLLYAGGRLFALKHDPQKSGAALVVFRSPEDQASERTVVDLNTLAAGKVFQSSWYKPSPDGTEVGMALGTGGSEDAALYVFDVATGKQIADPVPRVQFATAGGDMAWTGDGQGFYYTRYPQGNERPAEDANFYQQVYYHVLGSSAAQDKYVLGREFPRIGETALETAHDGKRILVTVEDGDGGSYEHFLIEADGRITQITRFADKVVDVQFGADDSLWLLSHAKSDLGELDHLQAGSVKLADAVRVVPPMSGSIEGTGSVGDMRHFGAADHALYVTVIDGGPEQILKFDLRGKKDGKVPVLSVQRANLHPAHAMVSLQRHGSSCRAALQGADRSQLCGYRGPPRVRDLEGWDPRPDDDPDEEGDQARRREPGLPYRLWRLCHQHYAQFYGQLRPPLESSSRPICAAAQNTEKAGTPAESC